MSPKHVFWQALISAILIFGLGILIGFSIEKERTNEINDILINSEINFIDSQMLGFVNEDFNVNCDIGIKNLFEFADRIYWEAQKLEKYDESAQLSDTLKILHKRYDLLRVMLWNQAIKLKGRCKSDFHIIVYLYQYNKPESDVSGKQIAFARYLENLKDKYGDKVLLIPIAGDLELSSLNVLKGKYEITKYPAVIFDENKVIYEINDLANLDIE